VHPFLIIYQVRYVSSTARGRIGNNNEIQIPLVYIAQGVGDNVLPIGSTSRVFVSSLRKNGYKVEFLESSGGHHVSRQVVDQAMSWLTAGFHQRG
jgi:predicted esterase